METVSSRQVYANPWMSVREDTLRRPDGSSGTYAVLDALVIALDGDRVHLVEQYRHALARRCWEFPSGSAEREDHDARALAARELREETGLDAGRLTRLGTLDLAPGNLSLRCRVFLATDLTQGPSQREAAEQDLRSAWFTRAEVEQMIGDGTLGDAKSLAAYALLLLRPPSAG